MARFIRTHQGTLIAIAVLTALWGLFFWRLLTPTQEDRAIFAEGDFPLHFYSYMDYQTERIHDGELPLWNPYNYGGDPIMANVQLSIWYPSRWITLFVLPESRWSIEALQLEVAVHYWLVSLMMYAYLMVLFQRRFPALFGSILWTYSGYLVGYPMLHIGIFRSVAWLPLLLLGIHLSITRPRWRTWGILMSSIALGLAFLGGHPQTVMQMTYLGGAYLLYFGRQNGIHWRTLIGRGMVWGIAGYGLAAVQVLPTFELMRLAYRSGDQHFTDKSVGFTVSELIQFVWPRMFEAQWWPLYLGVAGFLLALGALLRLQKRHYFWFVVILVSLFLSLGRNTVVFDIFYLIVPGFSLFREQERAASPLIFAMVILAVDQLIWLIDRPEQTEQRRFVWLARAHLILTTLVFLVAVIVEILSTKHELPGIVPNTFGYVALISLFFNLWLLWWQRDPRPVIPLGLAALIVLDLFTFGMRSPNFVADTSYNRTQEPDIIEILSVPDSKNIEWHIDGAAGIQTRGTWWRIPDIYGTGPFSLATSEELLRIRVDRRWEVLAVRYATMSGEVPDNVPLEAIGEGVNYDGQDYTLYELTDPRPMAHLVYTVREADNADEARDIMKEPWINLREIGVIEGSLPFDLPEERPETSTVNAFEMVMPEYVEMEVSTSDNALLTVAIPNYPGWRATVNGQDVDIIDTYAGLIGVPIRAGEHQKVTLHFVPMSLIVGGVISVVTLISILVYGIGSLVWGRRRKDEAHV